MIHVIGDSHGAIFEGFQKPYFNRYLFTYTAYNLIDKKDINELIKTKVKDTDQIIFVFGEIDCRIHIDYQWKNYDEGIEETISRYDKFLTQFTGYDFAVYNVVPAGNWLDGSLSYSGIYTPLESKIIIHRKFHSGLKELCLNKGYKMIDIWPYIIDSENRFAKPEYKCDEVHLNSRVEYYVSLELNKCFKDWK